MIIIGNKLVTTVLDFSQNENSVPIGLIFKGDLLIYRQAYTIRVRSCYGSGTWLELYNWIDDDVWKDSNS